MRTAIYSMIRGASAIIAILSLATTAAATPYVIVAEAKDNLVKFESKAPLDSFEGKTKNVWGRLDLDPANLGDELDLRVEVDLASLDTGIGLRNRHMRENHLHTDEFPTTAFQAGKIVEGAGAELAEGETRAIVVEGEMDLHGVMRTVRVPIELTRQEDGALHIVSRFVVRLSDYEIPRPGFLLMKLGEEQRVTVDVRAVPEDPTPDR